MGGASRCSKTSENYLGVLLLVQKLHCIITMNAQYSGHTVIDTSSNDVGVFLLKLLSRNYEEKRMCQTEDH